MDVITGEFKDLSSCFLLNVHYNGRIALLAGHKIYSLVQLTNNLTYSLTPKQSGLGDISDNTHVQDIKFNKGTKHNLIAEASDDNIILHDCTVNLNLNKSSTFLAHRRSITCLDWNDQNDLLGKHGRTYKHHFTRNLTILFYRRLLVFCICFYRS